MKLRKLKRSSIKKIKGTKPSPRISILLDKASSLINKGSLGQGENICHEIIAISPRTSEAYNLLGIIYEEQGLIDEAIAVLHKSIEFDGLNANAFFNLGTILGKQGHYEKAAALLHKGLSISPRIPIALNNFGLALINLGRLDEAIRALEKATVLDPRYGEAWFNLGDAYYCSGQLQKSVDALKKCIRLIPDFVEAHYNLSISLHELNLLPETLKSLQRTIELAPEHSAARHMMAALSGETPDRAPEEFVTNLFDQYANQFDADITDRLEYTIPSRLRKLLSDYISDSTRFPRVMDLGCGTGLSGQAFHDLADYLAGIDISKKMLDKARAKEIYDGLLAGDIYEQLLQLTEACDLFIATDVFSVESEQEKDFILRSTGRYAHSSKYIKKIAVENNFTVIAQEEVGIRKEKDTWIPGEIYLLQKKTACPP